MSEQASSDDSMNSEDGACMPPDFSWLLGEPGQGSSASMRRVLEFDVITETGDDDTTERVASEDDEVGGCSTSAAADSTDEMEPELEHEEYTPIPIHISDVDVITEAGDVEKRKRKAVEDGEVGVCSPPASGMLFDDLGHVDFISFEDRDFDVVCNTSESDDDTPLYLLGAGKSVEVPLVGHKEPISALAVQFQSASPILQEKIKLIDEQYSALRRTRGDGNCFYRSFMFSYLEHILETQDDNEVERIDENIEQCKKTLQRFGYDDLTYEDFFIDFIELLENVLQGHDSSISPEMLLERSCDALYSNHAVMFLRFVTSGEIRRREDFFAPFVVGLENTTVDEFCKESVEPMGVECDQVHVIALSDALGVPIRVVYLDQSTNDKGAVALNHHDFIPDQHDTTENTSVENDAPKPDGTPNPSQDGTIENATSVASAVPKSSQDGTTENTTFVASDALKHFETSDQDGTTDNTTSVAGDVPKLVETSGQSVAGDVPKLVETSGQYGTTENTASVANDALKLVETSGQDGTTENTASVANDVLKLIEISGQDDTTENTTSVASDAPKPVETSVQDGTTEKTTSVASDAKQPFVTLLYRPGHYDILYSK